MTEDTPSTSVVDDLSERSLTFMKQFVQEVDNRDNGREGKSKEDYGWDFLKVRVADQEVRDKGEYPQTMAKVAANISKNRYRDILPYDKTRIILNPMGDAKGDYINASYINGAYDRIEYICAQGPLEHTINDFWRMTLQANATCILMLCNLMENQRSKCDRYWPLKGVPIQTCGHTITSICEEPVNEHYIRRHFRVQRIVTEEKENAKSQGDTTLKKDDYIIHHFQYTDWPDYGRPEKVEPILDLLAEVHKVHTPERGPIVVHCSAGVGRSGAICAIDIAGEQLRSGRITPNFTVERIVTNLRKQRPAMVQSLDQYVLVFHAIAEQFRRQLALSDSHHYVNVEQYRTEAKPTEIDAQKRLSSGSDLIPDDSEEKMLSPVGNTIVQLGQMKVNDYPHESLDHPTGPVPLPTELQNTADATTKDKPDILVDHF